MIRVKICGITNLSDAMAAVDAGADALGFIFVEGTPRFVTPTQVAPIVRRLPPFVTPVGVFWDHPSGHVKAVAEACRLRALQFHGEEPPDALEGYAVSVIKTIKLPPASTIDGLPEYRVREKFQALAYHKVVTAILLDSAARWSEGESREPIEWKLVRQWGQEIERAPAMSHVRLILSGGLDPDNVARAVEVARPWAVDVNSGVEAEPGKKDHEKIRRFVAAAKGVR